MYLLVYTVLRCLPRILTTKKKNKVEKNVNLQKNLIFNSLSPL